MGCHLEKKLKYNSCSGYWTGNHYFPSSDNKSVHLNNRAFEKHLHLRNAMFKEILCNGKKM